MFLIQLILLQKIEKKNIYVKTLNKFCMIYMLSNFFNVYSHVRCMYIMKSFHSWDIKRNKKTSTKYFISVSQCFYSSDFNGIYLRKEKWLKCFFRNFLFFLRPWFFKRKEIFVTFTTLFKVFFIYFLGVLFSSFVLIYSF